MKPVITTGGSSSRHSQRETPAQPVAFPHMNIARAPTTICSFHTNKAQPITLVVPKGEDRYSGTEKSNDVLKTGEASSDNYNLLLIGNKGDTHSVEGASWRGPLQSNLRTSAVAGEHSESSSADGSQAKGEETIPLALKLKLRLCQNPLKLTSKSMKVQQRTERRRTSNKEEGDKPCTLLHEAEYQLQSQMGSMEAMNYDLQQSASLATSELEALKVQVQDLQGSLQSGESENDRLQAELRCLRQSMQLDMPQLQSDQPETKNAHANHTFPDFYDNNTDQLMERADSFFDLANEFLLRSN